MSNKNKSNILSEIEDPYIVPYKGIYAICDEKEKYIELIEFSDCFCGVCWSYHHYRQSSIIKKSKIVGTSLRHIIKIGMSDLKLKSSIKAAGIESVILDSKKNEVSVTYSGLGGGGIGATKCRALANGVKRYSLTDYGGEKQGKGTIILPKRFRVLIAIDDTDSSEKGATWTLTYNIAKKLSCNDFIFLSQSLVQLYPVPEKTQNCMSTILEFGCINEESKKVLISSFKKLLLKYTMSNNTGMLIYSGFSLPKILKDYSIKCRSQRLKKEDALYIANKCNIDIILNGNGIIGAMASFFWYSNPIKSSNPKFLKLL